MTATLVVPIGLDALVVNAGVLGRDAFRWWPYGYTALASFKSPEPEALQAGITHQDPGVYLHWTLPAGLRHGTQDRLTGEIVYPLVPNRWLVLRVGGSPQRSAVGWVIEADCPFTALAPPQTRASTQYLMDPAMVRIWAASPDPQRRGSGLNPAATGPQVAALGVAVPLAQWSERDPHAMFLTAVAPGNASFSAYVQHNANIFSFCDPLDGVSVDLALSYQVIGWYSDPASDVLAGWQTASDPAAAWAALMAQLGWSVADGVQASSSLYQGLVFGVGWNASGDAPPADPLQAIRDNPALDVAVGNTTADAFTALLAPQLAAKGHDAGTLRLLQAFQYDLLPVLNEVNGAALLDWKVRAAWFGATPGGYRWTLVPPESDGPPVPLAAADTAALAQLNIDSAALDDGLGTLWRLQWRLHGTWLKAGQYGKLPPPVRQQLPVTQAQLAQELDLANASGVAAQTAAQIVRVRAMLPSVPQPLWAGAKTSQEALRNGIAAFAATRKLSATHQLKAVAQPRYWQPNDPVVVISGLDAPPPQPVSVAVRASDALVTGFEVGATAITAQACAAALPSLGAIKDVPALVPQLAAEAFLLDPASAPSIATATASDATLVTAAIASRTGFAGVLPAQSLDPWRQPWQPLFLEWQAQYSYIPYETGSWRFDGTEHYFVPTALPATIETRPIGGICVLGPSAQFVFQAKLKKFIDTYSAETDLAQLYAWIDQIDRWQFLGQQLSGFNDLLALHDPRAYRRPGAAETVAASSPPYPIAALTGYLATSDATATSDPYTLPAAQSGRVHSVPYLANGTRPAFHGVRQGQFHMMDLRIYDAFGRVLELIGSGQNQGLFSDVNFPLVRDAALLPDASVQPGIAAVAQLPPRILQPSRLDFTLLDQANDRAVVGLSPAANPVCGWLLPNHLDQSFSVYAPDGTALGEYRLVVDAAGARSGEWQPPAHSAIAALSDVAAVAPHLAQLLGSAALASEAGFGAFLAAIDEALWTIDPLGRRGDQNLSVLVGRPLALVRARLQFALDGPAWTASDWAATVAPPTPDFVGYSFPVRLGDQATRQDGTIGYFLDDDYSCFNSVAATETPGFVAQIGPLGRAAAGNYIPVGFDAKSAALLTLLVDPRASVHAISGVLPVKQLDLPARFVDPVLARMEIGFRIGPLLTPLQPTPALAGTQAEFAHSISYPASAETAGAWSWWEPGAASAWAGYGLVRATATAAFGTQPNALREGILQLTIAMADTPE